MTDMTKAERRQAKTQKAQERFNERLATQQAQASLPATTAAVDALSRQLTGRPATRQSGRRV